jgi:hypothetical protein
VDFCSTIWNPAITSLTKDVYNISKDQTIDISSFALQGCQPITTALVLADPTFSFVSNGFQDGSGQIKISASASVGSYTFTITQTDVMKV